MKKILLLFLLVSVAFAIECPDGCECLSGIEFMEKYGMDYWDHFCEDEIIECGYDIDHDMPRFCLTIPPEKIGTGEAETGPKDLDDHSWYYDPDSSDIWNEMFQLKINAGPQEDIKLTSIELQAFGTGDDATDIARTEIYLDLESNGVVDPTDIEIGTAEPPYSQDNGTKKIGVTLEISKGSSKNIIIAYVMSANAPVGKTYGFTVNKIKAKGETSGVIFELGGLPKNSSTKTIVAPPPLPCTGNITLQLNQTSALPNSSITAIVEGIKNCDKTINISSKPCNFQVLPPSVCSCDVNPTLTGCSCDFIAPSEEGEYAYHACVDINADTIVNVGESASAQLIVEAEEIEEEEIPECTSDSECADNEKCTESNCIQVTGACGYASNHSWMTYECGEEAGCPSCKEGICENRECVLYELEVPKKAELGEEVLARLLRDKEPAIGKDIIIKDPKGREMRLTTDESGEILFEPQFEGIYSISAEETKASKELDVEPPADILELLSRSFYFLLGGEPILFSLVAIVIVIAIIVMYLRSRRTAESIGEETEQ